VPGQALQRLSILAIVAQAAHLVDVLDALASVAQIASTAGCPALGDIIQAFENAQVGILLAEPVSLATMLPRQLPSLLLVPLVHLESFLLEGVLRGGIRAGCQVQRLDLLDSA